MRKLILAAASAFFILSFSAAYAAEEAYKKGVAAYIAGNSDEAMLQLFQAHTANPADEKIKLLLAEVYIDQATKAVADGDYVTASKYAVEAEKLKVNDEKIIKLKESLKKLSDTSSEPAKKKEVKRPPPKKAAPRPAVQPSKRPPAPAKAPVQTVLEPLVIRERIIEHSVVAEEWKKIVIIGFIILLVIGSAAIVFLKLYLNERSKEAASLGEKEEAEKRIQRDLRAIRDSTAMLKAELAEEKKKAALAASRPQRRPEKKSEDEKIDSRLNEVMDSISSFRTSVETAGSAKKEGLTKGVAPPALNAFLPEYTEVPVESASLASMLERASKADARLNILWALGNKYDSTAVDTLKNQLGAAKGEEYKTILRSLKKIALRPETAPNVRNAVEEIFVLQRRKGIII